MSGLFATLKIRAEINRHVPEIAPLYGYPTAGKPWLKKERLLDDLPNQTLTQSADSHGHASRLREAARKEVVAISMLIKLLLAFLKQGFGETNQVSLTADLSEQIHKIDQIIEAFEPSDDS